MGMLNATAEFVGDAVIDVGVESCVSMGLSRTGPEAGTATPAAFHGTHNDLDLGKAEAGDAGQEGVGPLLKDAPRLFAIPALHQGNSCAVFCGWLV